jgi:hypothetical protein
MNTSSSDSVKPSSSTVPTVISKIDQHPSVAHTENAATKKIKQKKKKKSKRKPQQAVAPAPISTDVAMATATAPATATCPTKSKTKNKTKLRPANAVVPPSTTTTTQATSTNKTKTAASCSAPSNDAYNNTNQQQQGVDRARAMRESSHLEQALRDRGCCPDDEKQGWNEFQRQDALNILERILNEWAGALHMSRATTTASSVVAAGAGPNDDVDDDVNPDSTFLSDNSCSSSSSIRSSSSSPDKNHKAASAQPLQSQLLSTTTTTTTPWPGVALITFGSYRLRVHRPDSDLDVLALCPPVCHRGDFFTSLVQRLNDHSSIIKDVHPIASAFTPVIKFLLNGIHIDLLFGSVRDPTKLMEYTTLKQQQQQQQLRKTAMSISPTAIAGIQHNNNNNSSEHQNLNTTTTTRTTTSTPFDVTPRMEYMIDDTDLVGMDAAGVRSFNGARVTQVLLEMVDVNLEHYRITLRAVKEWAIIHGIYSNVLGFLGGVNFAILVAWVCMQHPKEHPTTLLRIFFRTFAMWHWPIPVLLRRVQTQPPLGGTLLSQ